MRERLAAENIAVSMIGTSVKLLDATAIDIDTLIAFARLADSIGCPWLRVFDGGESGKSIPSDVLAKTREWLTRWQEARQCHQVQAELVVETHDALASLTNTEDVLRECSPIHLLWDAHHTWRAGEAVADFFERCGHAVRHIHVKDSINRPSVRKPFTYCSPGDGEFPWKELGTALAAQRFAGCVSFEWERHWHPMLEPLPAVLPAYQRILMTWQALGTS